MTWTLNGQPAPRNTSNGWLELDGVQYPPDWPRDELEALGLVWVEPEVPPATTTQKLRDLADYRWQKTQRFTYDGVETQADPAIAVVTARVVAAQFLPPESTTKFKLADGEFRVWSAENLIAFGMAINAHVQACFDREDQLTALILAAEDPSSVDISTGWP